MEHTFRESLSRRIQSDGSIVDRPGGAFRTDVTAWGIIALRALRESSHILERSRARLKLEQSDDGRLCISRGRPESHWPTSLAVLAWQDSPVCEAAQVRAIHFLLEAAGVHHARRPDESASHDPSLKGWPWISDTHSWVEPTVMAVIALKTSGQQPHDRVREATDMLLDRQLPHGGWNYGNTLVFGRELNPMPESTGAALTGLAGLVTRGQVDKSLRYLEGEIDRLRTPIALGWALAGLGAWNMWPSHGATLVTRCLDQRSRYGEYETSALCLLLLGAIAGERDRDHPLFPNASAEGRVSHLLS